MSVGEGRLREEREKGEGAGQGYGKNFEELEQVRERCGQLQK